MKKSDAEHQVIYEFLLQKRESPGCIDPLLFYAWLRDNRPHLLQFRGSDYQTIAAWISRYND